MKIKQELINYTIYKKIKCIIHDFIVHKMIVSCSNTAYSNIEASSCEFLNYSPEILFGRSCYTTYQ